MMMRMERFLRFKYIVLVFIFSFISVAPLVTNKGFPPSHDGEYHIVRFYEFDKTLRDGNFFPRWAPDFNQGFGIPLFNYVYPLPNYIASFFHFFGISFIDSFKLSMFFASVIGGIFFYLWSKEFWGDLGGLVSSVFYTFSPYHFVDVYIRGSIGEVWSLALFPIFLWSITIAFKKEKKCFIFLSAIFLALIVLSHNILATMFFPFALSYMILLLYFVKNKRFYIKQIMFIIFLSLSLSSIFWLPALAETKFTEGLRIFKIEETFPEFYQYFFPSWGSGFADSPLGIQMSFQIGIANLLVVFVSFIIFFSYLKKKNEDKTIAGFFLLWFIFILYLMNKSSLFIWEKMPLMNYFQFPWRFLSIEILITSFLAGYILKIIPSKLLAFIMVIFVFLLGIGYAKPAYFHNRQDNYYITRSNFIDGTNSPANFFNTIWMNRDFEKQKQKINLNNCDGFLKINQINSTVYNFVISLKKDCKIKINTAYFPGWTSYIDGQYLKTEPDENGLITFPIKRGNHLVEVKFLDTFVRKLALFWSLSALILLLVLFIKSCYVKIIK